MKDLTNWKNKKVFITGGTSGLGKALAIQLHELGARVAILGRSLEPLKEMKEGYPGLVAIQGDVSKKENIHPIAAQVHSLLGDVDVLFNVAGYLGETPLKLLMDTECEDFEAVLETNLLGPFRLTKVIVPSMLLNKSGVVVNISSDAAVSAYPEWGSYSVSKIGVDHLSRIFDEELKGEGVRFLSIDPGEMNTPMYFKAFPDADPESLKDPGESALKILTLIADGDFSKVRRSV